MPPGRTTPAYNPYDYDENGQYIGSPPPPPPDEYIPGSTYVPPAQRAGYVPPDYPDPSPSGWPGYSSAVQLPATEPAPPPEPLPFLPDIGSRPIDALWPSWLPPIPAWIRSPNPFDQWGQGYRMWHLPDAPLVGGQTIYEGAAPAPVPPLPAPMDPPARNAGGTAFVPGQPLPVPTWDNTSGYLGVERNRAAPPTRRGGY